jgi:hypothetical protein
MENLWPSFEDIAKAYRSCRLGKAASIHQTRFEANLGKNLFSLYEDIREEKYKPHPTICFIVTKPKPREIFAAHFRDRIVHHLVVSRLSPLWERNFVYSSFACRKGKGTHGALKYLQMQVRRVSQGGLRPVYALQLDLASFFVTIHRPTLCRLLTNEIRSPFLRQLVETLYLHDARPDTILRGDSALFGLIPQEKSWFSQGPEQGLPIGNLISQFGANVYLTGVDHFVQRELKPAGYLRYMDDLTLLDADPQKLEPFATKVDEWLRRSRHQALNPRKTKLSCLYDGIDYLGYHGVQTDSPQEPFQLFLKPQKKWEWIQELNSLARQEVTRYEKGHILSPKVPTRELNQSLARVNSRLGYLRHAHSFCLRADSLKRFLREATENADLPPELGEPFCPWKTKRDYTKVSPW